MTNTTEIGHEEHHINPNGYGARDVHGIAASVLFGIDRLDSSTPMRDRNLITAIHKQIGGSKWRSKIVRECLKLIADGHEPFDLLPNDLFSDSASTQQMIKWLAEHVEYTACAREAFVDGENGDLDDFFAATECAAAIVVRDAIGELLERCEEREAELCSRGGCGAASGEECWLVINGELGACGGCCGEEE